MPGALILVVDDSRLARKMIKDRLEQTGYAVATADSGEAALAWLARETPELVISDVVMPGIDGYELCRNIRKDPRLVSIPVIMLTSRGGISEKVAGFEAGADDYLVKPFDPVELELRVKVLLARSAGAPKARPSGQIITVFSLRGGAGVTTLALNLATCLAGDGSQPVPLVDLALESGHAALMLDLRPRATWVELAKQESEAIDAELIRNVLTNHVSGIQILAAPPSPAFSELVNSKIVEVVLAPLAQSYPCVLVDTSSTLNDVTVAALDAASTILLVLAPELASLKAAAAALEVFDSLGYPPERTRLVLNWTFPQGGLPRSKIESALHKRVATVIPYDKVAVVQAINRGTPLVALAPSSPVSVAIRELAEELVPAGAAEKAS